MARKPEDNSKDDGEVMVQCICANVHLGNGIVLRAYRESTSDNWDDGDTATLPSGVADILVKAKQVKIVK